MPSINLRSIPNRLLHCFVVVMLVFGSVPTMAAAAGSTTSATPRLPAKGSSLSVDEAQANFNVALDQLINTPSTASPEIQALMQSRLEQAANEYQTAQAQAAAAKNAAASATSGGNYVYSANTRNPNGDNAAWLMLGQPKGSRQAFDQAFSNSMNATTAPSTNNPARSNSASITNVAPNAQLAGPIASPALMPGGLRPCAVVHLHVRAIDVHEAGDPSGGGEWHPFYMIVNGNRQEWNADPNDSSVYDLSYDWDVTLNDNGTSFRLETGGTEEDVGADDTIASINANFDSGNNWGLGDHGDHVSNDATNYTLYYTITCVSPLFADLRVSPSVTPNSLPAGDSVNYNFIVNNDGPNQADGVELTINLPLGLSNIIPTASGGTGCVASGSTYTCNLGSIGAGSHGNVQITADTPNNQTGTITASASTRNVGGQDDPYGSDNNTSINAVLLPKADTSVTLSAPTLVQRNQTGATTYQVLATINNNGPTYAPNMLLTPTLAPGVSIVSAAPSTGSCATNGVCNLGDMAIAGSATVLYTLSVDATVLERTTMAFTATVAMSFSGAVEIDSTNNSIAKSSRLTYWDLQLGAIAPGGDVNAVAYVGNEIFVGGAFGVKRWNGSDWSSVGSGGPGGTVYALLADGSGGVYAGGDFTNIGPRLAHWNGSGWSSVGTGVPNGSVYALALDQSSDLYVGGQFSQIGSLTTNNIARWDGTSWHQLGIAGVTQGYPNTQPQVRAIVADSGGIYAAGLFKTPAANIAYWNKAADAWEALDTGVAYPGGTSVVHALAIRDGRVYVGGRFTSVGGKPASRVAAWDPVAKQWRTLGTGIGGAGNLAVNALVVAQGELMAGGSFTTAGGVNTKNIAHWNGAAWAPVGSGADNGTVNALAVGETLLTTFVGGSFTSVDGNAASATIGQYHHEPAELVVSQSLNPNPPAAGQPLTIQLTVSNAGSKPVQNASLRDELPADATFVSATPANACTNDAGVVTCSVPSLPAGANTTFTVNVNVASVLGGPFLNKVWVGANQLDQHPEDNRLLTTPDVNAQADLSIALTAPATATAGQPIAYTLTVQNQGPATATNPVVTFRLPNGGATLHTATGMDCTVVNNYADLVTLTCAPGNLTSGESKVATLAFDLRDSTRGTHTASGSVTSAIADPNAANNTQSVGTTVEAVADLAVGFAAPTVIYQPADQVGSYSYNLHVVNNGPSLARAVKATLIMPAETTFVSASSACQQQAQTVVCQAGDLGVREAADFVVAVYVNVGTAHGTALAATLAVEADATESQPSNNSASASTQVTTDPAGATVDFVLTQDSPAIVHAGASAMYTLRTTNLGAIASGGILTDTLPAGATFDPSTSDPDCYEADQANRLVVCNIDELAVGQSREWQIAAFIPGEAVAGTQVTNSATIATTQPESNPNNNATNSTATVDTLADLALTQEASHTSAAAGETVTFTLTLENNGPSLAQGITLHDSQPNGMVLVSAVASQGDCAIANSEVSCALGELAARNSLNITLIMTAGSGTITNTATVQATTTDPDANNNEASAEVKIASAARETRTFGALEVSADTFIGLPDGAVQAFGDVWLGEYFYLSNSTDSVVINESTGTIKGEGTLTYRQEQTELFTGDFSGTFTNQAADIVPNADVEYHLHTFAGFDMPDFVVTGVNLVLGRTDGATPNLDVKTEGFEKILKATLFLVPGLKFGGTVETFNFVIGNITFEVSGAYLTNDGLRADTLKMTLPASWGGLASEVSELSITKDGLSIGPRATVSLPNFNLAGDKVQVKGANATVVYNGEALMLTGQGIIATSLPGNKLESKVEFSIDPDGEFSAPLDEMRLRLAGSLLEMSDLGVNNAGISVAEGVLTLPESLDERTVTVEDVTINVDGLRIGGAAVEIELPDIKIGSGNKVRFSDVIATLEVANDTYTFGIAAKMQIRLPQNDQTIAIKARVNSNGEFSGSLNSLKLSIANVTLDLTTVAFSNHGLKIKQGTLQLPAALGSQTAILTDILIDDAGISIGGGGAKFTFPDFQLGSDKITVKQVSAQLLIAADRTYKITLAGMVTINVKSVNASVQGSITIDSQKRVSGEVAAFKINVAGLEAQILKAKITAEQISIDEASLKTPASWGGAAVAVYNLRIGSFGVRIGGGRFAIPEIKAGGVTLGSLYGELKEEGNGYSISLGGKFRTPALGGPNCALGVDASMYVGSDGSTVMQLQAVAPQASGVDFQFRYVRVGLYGCRIPIAETGFYLTRVEGSLTLKQNQTIINLGVTVANDGEWLKGDADMRMQFNPWQMDFAGSVTLFSIFKAAEMKATMRSGFFSAELRVRGILYDGRASLTAWTTDGSFHLVGRAVLSVGFNKGSVWEECIAGICVSIPPFTVRVGEVGTEFGEFNGGVWGLKGWANVMGFRAGFYIDSGGTFSVKNIDQYQLVTPPSINRVRQLAAADDRRSLSPAERAAVANYTFAANEVSINQSVAVSTDIMFVMSRKGASPTLTLIDPSGQHITPTYLPNDIKVNEAVIDGGSTQTLYIVPHAAVGTWKMVLTGSGSDYIVRVLGANPAPTLTDISVVNLNANTATADWKLASDEITTTLDIYLTPGPITATVSITDANGQLKNVETPVYGGFPIGKTVATQLDGSASHAQFDLSTVPSGTYWVWFNADDGRNPPVRSYAPTPIIVSHDWRPSWQAGIMAQDHVRGFNLSWNKHPNPDVDTYKVEIGTQPGLVERTSDLGDQLADTIDNLTPGQLYYFTIVGIDSETGRVSRSETINRIATGPTFDLTTQGAASVVAGGSITVNLTLSTPEISYPDLVRLSADDLPDGVAVSFNLDDNMALPTRAGTSLTAVITTTNSMVGGVYDVPFQASAFGFQKTAILHLTVREPRIEVQASTTDVALESNGATASIALSASSIEGATGAVDLDLIDAPPGLVYKFSQSTLEANGTATLALFDTAKLLNGTYHLTLRSERGLQQQFIPLTLRVRKPVFTMDTSFPHLTIEKGETATFAVAVKGENLTSPVTVRSGAQSSPINETMVGFASAPNRSPKPSVDIVTDGTAYLVVKTSALTAPGNYRLVIEGQHEDQVKHVVVNLTIVDHATTADLAVTQTTSGRMAVIGGLFTYNVQVANYGPLAAEGVTLSDAAPVGTTVVAMRPSRGTCTLQAGQVRCDLFTLARGTSANVAITVQVTSTLPNGTDLVNYAEAQSSTAEGYAPDNSSIETTPASTNADLAVSVTSQEDQAVAGNTLIYRVIAWNNGASVAKNATVVTTLPSDVELVEVTSSVGTCSSSLDRQVVTCQLGDLSATSGQHNASMSIRTKVKPSARTTLQLASVVDSDTADAVKEDNAASLSTRVVQNAALSITHKAIAPKPATAGDEMTYQLEVKNTGVSDAPDAVVVDELPAEISVSQVITSQGLCRVDGQKLTCELGTLDANTSAIITIRGEIASAARATLRNTAQVSSSVAEVNTTDNTTVGEATITTSADLSTSITSITPEAFQFVLDNNGPSDASQVVMTATLPPTLRVINILPTQGSCILSESTITCAIGAMKAHARVVVSLRSAVPTGVFAVTVHSSVAAAEADPRMLNNVAVKTSSFRTYNLYLPVSVK